MTTPIFSITAAIFYFAWLWHDRSAVNRRESKSTSQPTKETAPIQKQPAATQAFKVTPLNLTNRSAIIRNEITPANLHER